MKRRDFKSKGEKERYNHMNAEFQRIARGGQKAFLRDECKASIFHSIVFLYFFALIPELATS